MIKTCKKCGGSMQPLKSMPPKSRCRKCGHTVVTGKALPIQPKEFRVLVCGSRDWTDEAPIRRVLKALMEDSDLKPYQVCVITGSAWEDDNGVDSIVEQLCRVEFGIACAIFRAPWKFMENKGNKRAAGPMRNAWMLKWGQPNMVLAFHPYIINSRGTKNMCNIARAAGIPVRVIEK